MIPTEVALLEKYLAEKELTAKLMRKVYNMEFMVWEQGLGKQERDNLELICGRPSPTKLMDFFDEEIWPEIEQRILS